MKRRRMSANPLKDNIAPELLEAIIRGSEAFATLGIQTVVVGGIAMVRMFPKFHTEDVDFAVLSETQVPERLGTLKKLSKHMFEDKNSGVVLDVVSPEHVRIPQAVFEYAMDTAVEDDVRGVTVRFASRLALFALKLSAGRSKDRTHLLWMMRHHFIPTREELVSTGVTQKALALYEDISREHDEEAAQEERMGW